MKTLILFGLSIIMGSAGLQAQSGFTQTLSEIESNNTSLAAMRQISEAGKISSRTALFLQNPEIGLNYLWGAPGEIGNRTDFSVMQSFDFPSAYKFKSNIADLRVVQADLEYQSRKIELLYEAHLICIDLVFHQKLKAENAIRLEYARNIADAVEKMYEQGKSGILEYNKARLNLANAVNDQSILDANIKALKAELVRYNGGKDLNFDMSEYPAILLPGDFDEWYATVESRNPLLQYMSKQVEISENEEKLSRALSLPKFSAGYMSEKVVGEKYQGLSVGMSVPLWEKKNTVKAARAQTAANIALVSDSQLQLYSMLKNHYNKALDFQKAADGYSSSLLSVNNAELVKRAYDMGEISLIEYLVEVQFYYETLVKAMETRRAMHRAFAELEKWD